MCSAVECNAACQPMHLMHIFVNMFHALDQLFVSMPEYQRHYAGAICGPGTEGHSKILPCFLRSTAMAAASPSCSPWNPRGGRQLCSLLDPRPAASPPQEQQRSRWRCACAFCCSRHCCQCCKVRQGHSSKDLGASDEKPFQIKQAAYCPSIS